MGNSCETCHIPWGPSLQHANSVGLVLSLTTGLVSTQFHIKYDDSFETLRHGAGIVQSNWQTLAGFGTLKPTKMSEVPKLPVAVSQQVEQSMIDRLEGDQPIKQITGDENVSVSHDEDAESEASEVENDEEANDIPKHCQVGG
jgi:hypothetical protein